MSKSKRHRRPRTPPRRRNALPPSAAAPWARHVPIAGAAERQLASALDNLDRIAADTQACLARYATEPDALFDLAELAAAVHQLRLDLSEQLTALTTAVFIVQSDTPLAAAHTSGAAWAGRQKPRYLPGLAQRARAGASTTYRSRLADTELAAATAPGCPQTTDYGTPCAATRVRRADGTRARACWSHLNTAERDDVRNERDAAIGTRACPRCHAAADQRCCRPDGAPTTVHTERLTSHQRP